MGRNFFSIFTLLLSITTISFAQNAKKTAIVKGKLINSTTKAAFTGLKVSIPALNVFTNADGDGNFVISEVPYGEQVIVINGIEVKSYSVTVTVDKDVIDMNDIVITPSDRGITEESSEIPTITLEENSNTSAQDDGVNVQGSTEAITGGSNNPFLGSVYSLVALYNFHYRGIQSNGHVSDVNGIALNNAETGAVSFNQFGKLYDIFRVRDQTYGLSPSSYAFGGTTGSEYRDATAANQYAGTKISYTLTDRNYNNGITLSHSSGLMKNGWAYSLAFSKRWASEGYVPGTFYNDYAYYAAATKVIGKGSLNIVTTGSPLDHGKSASSTQEVYSLDNSNYFNHNWGYFNGEKRNARVEREFRPLTILNYEYKPSDKTRWNTALGYEFGKDRNSSLDGYNSSDPYGDYYRNLPSYYYTMNPPDSATGHAVYNQIKNNPEQALQLNWNRMYQDNYQNVQTMYNVNGIAGNNYTGKQSEYVLSDQVADIKKLSFNTNVEHAASEHLILMGGLSATSQSTENYKQLTDLLGGDYFVNYNQFASQQYIGNAAYNQNNLNDPNAVIKTGDKYGYDYTMHVNKAALWGQAVYNYDKFSFFGAVNGGDYSFNRDGFYRNGLFANNSYGTSATHNFLTYAVKGGVSYKIDSRNVFFINGEYSATPPTPDNTYISAQTRDFTVANPSDQHNLALETGYLLHSEKLSARIIGYVIDTRNATEIKRFYDDDPAYYTFVNYVMTNENTRSIGAELSLNYKLLPQLSILGTASVGEAFYTNNPNINVYLDNDPAQNSTPTKTYIKNYYVSSGPQSTYVVGFNYRPKKDLFININFNYFDRNYVEINPNRRTTAAAGLYPDGSAEWHQIFDQQKLPSAFTVDIRAGKNFQLSRMSKTVNKLSKNSVLNISGSIGNLLNNTNIINSGYEQLRYDYVGYNPDKFANKYIYAMGINFSLNATLRF